MDVDAAAVDELAQEMFAQTVASGQSARRVPDEARAAAVRAAIRRFGRDSGVRLRTARMEDLVVVARVDADLWRDARRRCGRSSARPADLPCCRPRPDTAAEGVGRPG